MLKIKRIIRGVTLFIGLGFAASGFSQTITLNVQGLASTCFNCHGTEGRSSHPSMASLAGKPAIQLREQLQAFNSTNPPAYTTVMDRLVQGLSNEEISALAQYFSQLPAQQPGEAK